MIKNKLILLGLSVFIAATNVHAACEAKDDPCAPKKALDSWNKSLALGLNYTSGNSDTTNLSLIGKVNRETSADIIDFDATYGYGEDRQKEASGGDKKNKDDFRANAQYKYLLDERVYAGAGLNFLYDDIAKIDYRVNVVPTLGYFLLKDADFTLGVDAGPAYTFEQVNDVENNYFSPKVGENFQWIISCTSKIYQKADIFFDTDNSENYNVNAELGIESAISSSLSLVVLVRDTYDNEPGADLEKNDLATITALKVAL